jgi:hypothetical protein
MQKVYNERGFDDEIIKCGRCGWEGSGYDVNIIDLYGLSKVKEVHCPSCDSYLGGVQNADNKISDRNDRFFNSNDPFGNQFG